MIFITNESEINYNNGVSSFYFYSDWMPFHKKMLTLLEKLQEENKNIKHFAINVENIRSAVKRFNLESIPTIILFKDGKEIKRIVGVVLTSAMRSAYADI